MKKLVSIVVALFAVLAASAQNIAVVDPSNSTSIYQTLDEAISNAVDGCTIYLPGGGFAVKNDTKIDKKVTILGIGHKADNDNADGNTSVNGNLTFIEGSDGSSVMGLFLSGNVDITANNILVKLCNINAINVAGEQCSGISINQVYLRAQSYCNRASVSFTNCISQPIRGIKGGTVRNCIIYGAYTAFEHVCSLCGVEGSTVAYNVIARGIDGSGNLDSNNITNADFGQIFVDPRGVTPESDFHIKSESSVNSSIGIYGGSGFDDAALVPIPRIISKKVAEQTDGSGKLKISVTVKAN